MVMKRRETHKTPDHGHLARKKFIVNDKVYLRFHVARKLSESDYIYIIAREARNNNVFRSIKYPSVPCGIYQVHQNLNDIILATVKST